jgi:hypothetical protein
MTGRDGGNDEITGEYRWEVEIGSLSRNILLGHRFQRALLAILTNRDDHYQLGYPAI